MEEEDRKVKALTEVLLNECNRDDVEMTHEAIVL
jgi:hypothetical protein